MTKVAGIITNRSLDTSKEMYRMLSAMTLPTPPSQNGLLHFENFTIGSAGSSIFSNPSKTHYLAFDGEIHNAPEIKQKLLDAGQMVQSDKIEDLLILAYQTWGTEFFKWVNGAFVLVIFDKKQKKIIITRDRLGCRTLFWTRHHNCFVFASQLKGILSASVVSQSPDLISISSYFFLGYFSQDKTPIKNVNRLLPGYFIEIDEDENIVINKYWSFTNLSFETSKYKQEEVSEQLDHLLLKAVQTRGSLKEPTSCLLTGDIGSATIANYVKKRSPETNLAFSFQFEGQSLKMDPFINKITSKLGFENIKETLSADQMLNEIQQIVWHLDEPIADPYAIGIWNIAKRAQNKCTSIFSGVGSHEFLGSHIGESTLSYEPLLLWFLYLSKPLFLKAIIPLIRKVNKKTSLNSLRFFQRDFWSLEFIKQQALFSEKSLKRIAPQLKGLFDLNLFLQQSYQYLKFILYQNFQVEDYLFFDAETTLSNRLLIQYENLFEAKGIKFFSPFLDLNVTEFLIQVPESYKSRGRNGGLPLYKILEPNFKSSDLANFEERNPWFLSHWMNHPKMNDLFMKLTRGVLVESNIINGKNLRSILEKKTWKYHQFERMWAILVLEIWFNLFINNPIYSYPKEQSINDFFIEQKICL